ncbi:MAG: COQ9 family protein, partial [Sphingomonas bacterium]|nr:COQ9 family protein [Sphingomonas bacterium]
MTDQSTPLNKIRARLALGVGENAVFDGWTVQAVDTAAAQLGIDPAQARLAFPKAKLDMIDAYVAAVDAAMMAAFPPEKIAAMKVRDRIRAQLWFRLETMAPAR